MLDFTSYIRREHDAGRVCIQPRMGLSRIAEMKRGMEKVAAVDAATICTITLDSFTRVGNFKKASEALRADEPLNGFPIVSHDIDQVRELISHIETQYQKPIQVRHGSPRPGKIFQRMVDVGVVVSEGGPISYCLPYGSVSLEQTLDAWEDATRVFAEASARSHIESFAGCMLGQLCPPSLLVALNIIEGIFFHTFGLRTMSFSYAQGTSAAQDLAGLLALNSLRQKYLSDVDSHTVFYMYMGIFPQTTQGAKRLMVDSIGTVLAAGAERVIVKTPVESSRIPSIEENVASLEYTQWLLNENSMETSPADEDEYGLIVAEADSIIESVLSLDADIKSAVATAFRLGRLDVPYCIHPNNQGRAKAAIDGRGYLRWISSGGMAIRTNYLDTRRSRGSDDLKESLHFLRKRYDSHRAETAIET
jgi:methylaspartate mutase epsilon subunit